MTDRRQVPVDTTEGWQPRASGGERILVALAAIALVGGVLIVAGNLLRKDDAVSRASGSPLPTSSPSPTPIPSPTIMELVVESTAPGPTPSPAPALFGGWIRAAVDLPILESPSEGAAVTGTLPAGTLAYADEQDVGSATGGWMTIEAPDPTGWVATRPRGTNLVERLVPATVPYSGTFQTLAAGPSGFVAIASAAASSDGSVPPSMFVSSDGVSWHAASGQPGFGVYPVSVAWGPKGWLMASTDRDSERKGLWSSPDGDRWTLLGTLQSGYPQGLAGSGAGYLLTAEGGRGFGNSEELWFSTDGLRWTRSNPLLPGYAQVTGTTMGFYATATDCCGPPATTRAAFSTDGLTWFANSPKLLVAAVDGTLLAIQAGPNGLGGQPLHGSFYHGQVRWRPVPGGDAPFAGALVTSIASDGQRATAFGWDPATEASFTWTSVGGPWRRHALPSAFGGPPSAAVAANGRVVVVGNRWNTRGPNPIVWHENAAGGWQPEPSPVLGFAPDPSTDDCSAPPRTALDLANLDRAMAVACLGDAPLTIRAWSSECNGCYGTPDGTYDEPWLASPSTNVLFLSPVKWLDQWSTNGVMSPRLGSSPDPAWVNHWLELTGHFDDAASARCHWNPPPEQLQYYSGFRPLIETCRQQFVVTAVRVVEGP